MNWLLTGYNTTGYQVTEYPALMLDQILKMYTAGYPIRDLTLYQISGHLFGRIPDIRQGKNLHSDIRLDHGYKKDQGYSTVNLFLMDPMSDPESFPNPALAPPPQHCLSLLYLGKLPIIPYTAHYKSWIGKERKER